MGEKKNKQILADLLAKLTPEQLAHIKRKQMVRRGEVRIMDIPPPLPLQHFWRGKIRVPYHERKKAFVEDWDKRFKKYLAPACTYKMHLESSPTGLLHWHGSCTVTNLELFNHALGIFKYDLGCERLEVDTKEHDDFRRAYEMKDSPIMRTVLDNDTVLEKSILRYLTIGKDGDDGQGDSSPSV